MIDENFYKILGKNIKSCRENSGLTQEQLSERAGISLDYLGKIEVSINKPGLKSLIKIANALNISLTDLLNGL